VVATRTLEPGRGRLARVAAGTAHARRAVGEEICAVACGLDGVASVGDLAAAALGWKGRIDLFVNNATFLGEATFRSLDELSLANWQCQVNLNVIGAGKALVPAVRGTRARG
jgi:NAD(P)-dependent dehydrogenase (short-subunit alcohol dehydrogenase family)